MKLAVLLETGEVFKILPKTDLSSLDAELHVIIDTAKMKYQDPNMDVFEIPVLGIKNDEDDEDLYDDDEEDSDLLESYDDDKSY